ncbi:MAG TPA: cell filamentation protein Fic, partial [Thermotogota bacterium]|nr:cell filamentation protein Fic [Thermotogota bacterium]
YGKGSLPGAGTVSHQEALDKANAEYEKYRRRTVEELSPVERDFLASIKDTQKKLEGKSRKTKDGQL